MQEDILPEGFGVGIDAWLFANLTHKIASEFVIIFVVFMVLQLHCK